MLTKKSKTVFIEYSSSSKGQHFMTVVQVTEGKRQIIGRIFREYDSEKKEMHYRAVDWQGNAVFFDINDLSTLKKKFIEHGQHMAMIIPKQVRQFQKGKGQESSFKNMTRGKEVQQIREKRTGKNVKTQEKNEKKVKNLEDDRIKPTPEMYDREKELNQIRQPETKPDLEQKQEAEDTSEKSERDIELEEIRGNDDREQEQEQEMEMDM